MLYNRSQIINIVKQQIKNAMKKTEWQKYIDSVGSDDVLMQNTLVSFGLGSLDIFDVVLRIEDELGISFDDKDFKKRYSDMTIGDLVNIAVKNYEYKMNQPELVNNTLPTSKSGKIVDYNNIEESVRKTFATFGVSQKEFVATKPIKTFGLDFMDALGMMNDLDREFNLPNSYICDKFMEKIKSKNGSYDLISYNDFINILCEKFKILRPQSVIIAAIISAKQNQK